MLSTSKLRSMLAIPFLISSLLVSHPILAATSEMTPPERVAFLKKMQELRTKSPSMQSEFSEERTSHLLNKPIVAEGNVAFQIPDKFRREIKGGNSSLTVCDGKTLWLYYPNFKEVEIYTLGQQKFLDESI